MIHGRVTQAGELNRAGVTQAGELNRVRVTQAHARLATAIVVTTAHRVSTVNIAVMA